MIQTKITYLGGIDDITKGKNLTGSSSLLEVVDSHGKKVKILVDYGMHQGKSKENEFNKKVEEDAIRADYLVITHAHMDHVGRVPYLIKKGFKGRILTTSLTLDCAVAMCEDYVRLTRVAIAEIEEKNKKVFQLYEGFLTFQNLYERAYLNPVEKKEKLSITERLNQALAQEEIKKSLEENQSDEIENNPYSQKKAGKGKGDDMTHAKRQLAKQYGISDYKAEYQRVRIELEKKGIENKQDILKILDEVPELLYDEDDVASMKSQTQILEVGDDMKLEKTIYIYDLNSKHIEKIPEMVAKGYHHTIYINPVCKTAVINKWKNMLSEFRLKSLKNHEISQQNKELQKRLYEAYDYITLLKENVISKDASYFASQESFLHQHHIQTKDDIIFAGEKIYEPPFQEKDVKMAQSLLKADPKMKKQDYLTSIRLNFIDAGHIEGSVQAQISLTSNSVKNILGDHGPREEVQQERKNILFSGDLGRIKDPNKAGTPDVANFPLGYYQVESTYAGRNHLEKYIAEQLLLNSIIDAKGKVIIPCFSMQRTQEILLFLLEYMAQVKRSKELIDANNIKIQEYKRTLENTQNPETIPSLQMEISALQQENSLISEKGLGGEIILDSVLSQTITQIYLKHNRDKYYLLSQEGQIATFGKVVVRVLEEGEYKDLYSYENRNKKQIILSASGMAQAGSILNHLNETLENPRATIVFVGYTPENTNGGKIKSKLPVTIFGKELKVRANVVDVPGFSGHIDEEEILDLLSRTPFAHKATIALTHGGEARHALAKKIKMLSNVISKKVQVIIPKLEESYVS